MASPATWYRAGVSGKAPGGSAGSTDRENLLWAIAAGVLAAPLQSALAWLSSSALHPLVKVALVLVRSGFRWLCFPGAGPLVVGA